MSGKGKGKLVPTQNRTNKEDTSGTKVSIATNTDFISITEGFLCSLNILEREKHTFD